MEQQPIVAPEDLEGDAPPAPPVRKLKGTPVEYQHPAVAERLDLSAALGSGVSPVRVCGAALALSWPYLRRKLQANRITYRGDVPSYGGKAVEWLISQGIPYSEIDPAAADALTRALSDIPGTKSAVEAAAGNFGPETGSGTT